MSARREWLKNQPEGQTLERKSCYDRSSGVPRPRKFKEIMRDVAETVVAMANADGGAVVLGLEDDGTVTGVPERYNLKGAESYLRNLILPTLNVRAEEILLEGRRVWIFSVDWSPKVHRLSDGRYLYRIHDQNIPYDAGEIEAMKAARLKRPTEEQIIAGASLSDLDLDLVREVSKKTGLNLNLEETLLHYRLAEQVNEEWRLTLAALLLFGKDPTKWHPRCGLEFIKWRGTKRHTGTELNVIKRIRIEAPLVRLIEKAFSTIQQYIPERQVLVDLFFEERLEYPTFAWQEAIVNAVAHRDYSLRGMPVEVQLFDDRMEIRSPGELIPPVTLERLQKQERIHASRNPRIVRVLTDLGYMRELGEGIPRMFEVMEREGLRPPEFSLEGGCFVVTLRSEPVYRPETMQWLKQFDSLDLSRNQLRLLAYAYEHGGRFTSRAYQKLVGVDIYTASRDIKELIRKGIVRRTKPRGRVYEIVVPSSRPKEKPPELMALEPILREKGYIKNEDIRRVLGVNLARARDIASRLVALGWLEPQGERRWRRYVLRRDDIEQS